jgi:hypothetical protein
VELKLIEVMIRKMFLTQFESIVNLIQMILMKVMYNLRNMMIKEFQHFVELKLI